MIQSDDQSAESTRQRLFDAALSCFARRGYRGTTTRAICDAADVNLALLSYHWGGKGPLFEAVVRELHERLLAIAQRGALCGADYPDPVDAIRGFLEVVTADLLADPRPLRVMAWAQLAPEGFDPDLAHGSYAPAVQAGATWLTALQRQGLIPADVDVELALITYYGLVAEPVLEPGVHRHLFQADHTDPAHAARLQRHLVASGLRLLGLESS